MKLLHRLVLPIGALLVTTLTACVNEDPVDALSLALAPAPAPAPHYPAMDCRAKHSLSTQKGCAPSGVLIGQR